MSESVRVVDFLDPELAKAEPARDQRRVATPSRHVWVRASAGSGKTKVLVDRLLRLLLPDINGAPGVAPDKILCLTFTKAGAAEMSLRLQKRLLEWSALGEDKLKEELTQLIGQEAPETMVTHARQLFARVLDAPSRLKIQTIHAFCQTVLGRFPVETGLSPDFKVIEEKEAGDYLNKALLDNLIHSAEHPDSDIGRIFNRLAIIKNQQDLQEEIQKLINEPIKLQDYMQDVPTLMLLQAKLARDFGINDLDAVTEEGFCRQQNLPRADIKALADLLDSSNEKDKEKALVIYDWLSANDEERFSTLQKYISEGLKKTGTKKGLNLNPEYWRLLEKELARLDQCKLARNIMATADLMFLSHKILADFDRHKKFMGVMDYNDLIFNTRRLLTGEFWKNQDDHENKKLSTSWVLFKLDEGIDHILVDESQDTNPDQWKIVELLTEEYFSGAAKDVARPRTLFVVGDEKQSIFSFQRADPAVFHKMRAFFAEKIRVLEVQEGFEESLIFSFRSTAPVLKLTDAVFEDGALLSHIGLKNGPRLRHISFRSDNKSPKELYGSVELWPPVIEEKSAASESGWQLPFGEAKTNITANERLAKRIALRIQTMVAKGEAHYGDFMILMRQRSALMHHIIRELKKLSVPVSGLDRIVLKDTLIVQDMLAVCDFVLLPDDSFSLACLLKSPFVGLSEDQLMALSAGRAKNQSLWSALRDASEYKYINDWLFSLIALAGKVQVFEFLESLMILPCPADPRSSAYRACQTRLGADVLEPLDEILSQSLKLELQNIRTLQDFVYYQKSTAREIKREMEEAGSEVRLMTVHGSKGLEAPIVILPDTLKPINKSKLERFLWPDKSNLTAPLWADSKETRSIIYEKALDRAHDLQIEESSRLLYVAMTRAKDTLMICGASDKEEPPPTSWYAAVKAGFDRLPNIKQGASGELVFRLTDEQPKKSHSAPDLPVTLPAWIRDPAPAEDAGLNPFTPSAQGMLSHEDEGPAYSPLDRSNESRFRRGLATHKLLQILPDLDPSRREDAARRYMSGQPGFSQTLQNSIVSETLAILNDSVFAPVFGPNSLAEVPVTGELPGRRLINGQIDRLVVMETEILIVDYKTNRPSPGQESDIPAGYRAQLKAYADALALIYPGREIKCALLWTDRPLLMPVSI